MSRPKRYGCDITWVQKQGVKDWDKAEINSWTNYQIYLIRTYCNITSGTIKIVSKQKLCFLYCNFKQKLEFTTGNDPMSYAYLCDMYIEFYYHRWEYLKTKRPFIYHLLSFIGHGVMGVMCWTKAPDNPHVS